MTAFPLAPQPAGAFAPYGGLTFALERPQDAPAADALIERGFGPGRLAKTAERLREHNHLRPDLSICAWDHGRLAGVTRQWPVLIGAAPAVFLGPFAVDDPWRHHGLGAALIERAVILNDAAGERATLLVGGFSYFNRFGFETVPRGRIALPGPVDPRRLLWRAEAGDRDSLAGPVSVPAGR